MSGRGSKRRGRPPKTPTMDRQSNSKFQYHLLKKPKYLMNRGSDSQLSTPTASRASSPHGSDSSRPSIAPRPSTSRLSVTAGSSNRKSGRGNGTTSQAKGRGKASQSATPYSKKEYMYGSDFGESSDEADADDDMLVSPSESDSLIGDQESESDFSLSSFSSGNQKRTRAPSPEPLWLQQRDIPTLELPGTSDDLLIPVNYTLRTASVYEIMRRFKYLMRLTPFRLEDLCAALASDDQSALLIEVHVALLKAILREEDSQNTHFGPLDQKDSVNISLYLIDQYTWPEILRSYIESDPSYDRNVLKILSNTEYPYTSIDDRLTVLQFLTDQFLVTTMVRDDIIQEGPIHYDDHCRICHRLGDLLCCETCPAVFHLECVDPPMVDVPTEDWQCSICKSHQISGVYDCISTQEKQGMLCRQDHLGYDRHGRKYWFISRRIFVEDEDGKQILYYSTVDQLQLLMSRLDSEEMELSLCRELADLKEEIERQMEITETLTNANKGSKRSYLEVENAKIRENLKNAVEGEPTSCNDSETKESKEDLNVTIDESKNGEGNTDTIKHATRTKTGNLPQKTLAKVDAKTVQNTSNNNLIFRLGMENNYKTYVNQYTTSPIALNKPQRNEERDKKRHLSHKFSLTTASEFKWAGTGLTGSNASLITALRATIISLEQNISSTFMHPNWSAIRKQWMTAVTSSSKAIEFAKVLTILITCFKSPIFANVWHEQLGHIKLQRITAAEREEKKKLEKREKREKDDEEERNRLSVNFVKYSLGLKHQVWKQKGEEYRIHGQWGWVWFSYGRRELKKPPTSESIRIHKVMVPIKQSGVNKIICIRSTTFEYLKECRNKISQGQTSVPVDFHNIELVDTVNSFEEIDVSKALAAPGRLLYPKQAKKSKLDDLLAHRVSLRDAEEAKLKEMKTEDKADVMSEMPKPAVVAAPKIYSQTSIEKQLAKIVANRAQLAALQKIPNIDMDLIYSLAKSIQAARQQFGQLNRFGKQYKCYTKECNNTNTNVFSLPQASIITCYSPLCLQKTRVKRELLTLLRKAHTAGNGNKDTVSAIMAVVNKKPANAEQKTNELKVVTEPKADDPSKMQKDFKEAVVISYAFSEEDITDCISTTANAPTNELVKQEEINDVIKSELFPECEPMVFDDDHQVEVEVGGEQKDDSCEIKLENESTPSKRQRLNDSMNEDVTSTIEINSDDGDDVVETRTSKRKSLRNVKSKTQYTTTTTTTTNRTTTEFDDGSIEDESNSSMKTRSRESQSDSKKIVTVYNCSSTVAQKKYVSHPNRRFAASASKTVKKEECHQIIKEYGPNGDERIYTISTTAGRIYLKKTLIDTDYSKSNVSKVGVSKVGVSKYPVIQSYLTRKGTRSLMVLPRHELLKMSRCGGKYSLPGYHQMSKTNNSAWPYPNSRPQFKTSWLFRTMNLRTLSAICLQLRIVWCCLRWDDMATKPPTNDGKHQVTTETEIMSLEILKYRHCGRFSERTQYLRRKVVIPLELPKTIREFTSIRSGLRKRKRAESPQKTDPQVSEEWVDEDKLELWEIKQFGEKQERANAAAAQPINTRTTTGKLPAVRTSNVATADSPSGNSNTPNRVVVNSKATPEEIKEKMEQQLRIQRAAHNQKRAQEMKAALTTAPPPPPLREEVQNPQLSEEPNKSPFIGQRKIVVKNADGTTKIIQQNIPAPPAKVTSTASTNNAASTSAAETPSTSTSSGPGQKVQIIRGPDGKVSVRGLNAGQQLIQMPDGKLHVLTSNQSAAQNKTPIRQAVAGVVASPKTPATVVKTPATVVTQQTPGQKQVIVRQQIVKGPPTILNKAAPKTPQTLRQVTQQGTPNQVKVQQVSSSSPGVQKIVTTKAQILNNQKIVQSGSTNLQQLLTHGGQTQQKVLVNQATGNRVIIQQSTKPQQTVVQPQQIQVQQQIIQGKPQQQQQQQIVSPSQKITQQYVNTTNKQQEVLLNGQRIILAPGQRIITSQTQQPPPQQQQQMVQQVVQQQVVQQQVVQQQVVQQQPQQQQQQMVVQTQPQQQIVIQQQQPIQQQVIVNNSNLAQQLAQGKLQVTNINGQQVIIKPLGNNQAQIVAHIKTQTDGQAHIVQSPVAARSDQLPDSTTEVHQQIHEPQQQTIQSNLQQQQQQFQQQQQPQQLIMQTSPQQQQQPTIEQSLLQGQPPGTVIKCVTAQVIQTQQGPRIVLQGLAGNDFTPQQLSLVQQQVKQQLLKAQESSGKSGVLGPTKIYLAVQPAIAVTAQPPPLAPVQSQQQALQQVGTITGSGVVSTVAVETSSVPTTPTPSKVIKIVGNGTATAPKSASSPSTISSSTIQTTMPTPTKVMPCQPPTSDVKNQLVQKVLANKNLKEQKTIQQQRVNKPNEQPMISTTEEETVSQTIQSPVPNDNSFVVTPDYIQQTIKNALKQENLNPEIEEKLLNLQRYQEKQMRSDDVQQKPQSSPLPNARNSLVHQINNSVSGHQPSPAKPPGSATKRRPTAARNLDDDDWVIDTPRRKPVVGAGTITTPAATSAGATLTSPTKKGGTTPTETSPSTVTPVKNNKRSLAAIKRESEKKKAAQQAQIRLNRHKEQLKKDILKKRALLEKELQMSIQRELASELKGTNTTPATATAAATPQAIKSKPVKATAKMLTTAAVAKGVVVKNTMVTEPAEVQQSSNNVDADQGLNTTREDDRATEQSLSNSAETAVIETQPTKDTRKDALTPANPSKRKPVPTHKATIKTNKTDSSASKSSRSRKGGRSSGGNNLAKKKEKLYCLCRTPYDDSKFYVGCDLCNNWFHGDCVGISELASKTLSEFICGECKHARDTQELYCLCRKPYDESQFYICCDKCQDWFHGRCVGILQSEADSIDEYICPKCQQNSDVNKANMKSLSQLEHESLKSLIKQIQSHKSSWPFMEPVDPHEAPDYYNVIKDPMDLQKIEQKITDQLYTNLNDFIGDMTKIFDNCRFYNTKESPFYRCAESLEGYFVQKIKHFRETLAASEQQSAAAAAVAAPV